VLQLPEVSLRDPPSVRAPAQKTEQRDQHPDAPGA
jgi:hypothetical protein